jgi:hypothetical protein
MYPFSPVNAAGKKNPRHANKITQMEKVPPTNFPAFSKPFILLVSLLLYELNLQNVHGKRSRRNGAGQASAFAFVPGFLQLMVHSRNLRATAMGSTIHLRSGTPCKSEVQLI